MLSSFFLHLRTPKLVLLTCVAVRLQAEEFHHLPPVSSIDEFIFLMEKSKLFCTGIQLSKKRRNLIITFLANFSHQLVGWSERGRERWRGEAPEREKKRGKEARVSGGGELHRTILRTDFHTICNNNKRLSSVLSNNKIIWKLFYLFLSLSLTLSFYLFL